MILPTLARQIRKKHKQAEVSREAVWILDSRYSKKKRYKSKSISSLVPYKQPTLPYLHLRDLSLRTWKCQWKPELQRQTDRHRKCGL